MFNPTHSRPTSRWVATNENKISVSLSIMCGPVRALFISQDSTSCGWMALRRDLLSILKSALQKHHTCFTWRDAYWGHKHAHRDTKATPTEERRHLFSWLYLWIYLFIYLNLSWLIIIDHNSYLFFICVGSVFNSVKQNVKKNFQFQCCFDAHIHTHTDLLHIKQQHAKKISFHSSFLEFLHRVTLTYSSPINQ